MPIIKIIEILAESTKSWEDAAQNAVSEAAKSLHNIRSVWVKNLNAEVDGKGKITHYRMNVKISFEKDAK